MTTSGAALELDHQRIDSGFDALIDAAKDGRVEVDLAGPPINELRRHIWIEEEIFFPPLRAAGMVGPVLVMLREHGEIWTALKELETLLATDSPEPQAILTIWGTLEAVLTAHNFKEEKILYATADQALDASVHEAVIAGLSQELPEGWTAEMF